jgi:ribosome-associated protein
LPASDTASQQAAKEFAIAAARMAADTRCVDVVVLDVSGVSPITDFLVIGTGTSARQMRSVCDDIEELAKPMGFKPLTRAGHDGGTWILTDFVNVVVHIFSTEARGYYDLDNLWGDGVRVEWKK